MTETKTSTWVDSFVARLKTLPVADRTALKRSLGLPLQEADAKAAAAFYKVYQRNSAWDEDVCFITACAAAAFHNCGGPEKEFALRLREMGAQSTGVENKLLQLLDIPRKPENYFAVKLGRLLRQTLSKGLNVDFAQLLRDLLQWEHPSRFVQLKWARDFYVKAGGQPDESMESNDADENNENNENDEIEETE
ncbi:MAG: type I-E CRISPR-associated protein Cse2/CasB [Eubacteriales bacterium]|nr:type I-E CRISPR-associated protein Cse2/CasB [Eubacteriales bacterium]